MITTRNATIYAVRGASFPKAFRLLDPLTGSAVARSLEGMAFELEVKRAAGSAEPIDTLRSADGDFVVNDATKTILPGPGVIALPVGEHVARATMTYADLTVQKSPYFRLIVTY